MKKFRRKTAVLLLILVCFFLAFSDETTAQTKRRKLSKELNEKGKRFFNAKQDDKALRLFEMAIKADPEYDAPHQSLAEWYYRYHRMEDAIEEYKKAIALNPKKPAYYIRLGDIYRKLKKYKEAIHNLTEAKKLAPDDPEIYFKLGLTYKALDKNEKARENLSALISVLETGNKWKTDEDLKDMYWRAHRQLGKIYMSQKKWDEAYKYFKKIVDSKEADKEFKKTVEEELETVQRQKTQMVYGIAAAVAAVIAIIVLFIFWKKFILPQQKKKRMAHLPASPREARSYQELANFLVEHLKVFTDLPKSLVYFVKIEGEPLNLVLADGLDRQKFSGLEVNWDELPKWITVNRGRPFVYESEKKEIPFMRSFPEARQKLDPAGPRVGVPFIYQNKFRGLALMCYPKLKSSEKRKLKSKFIKNTKLITDLANQISMSADKIFQKEASITDSVTTAYNQIYFREKLPQEISKAQVKKQSLSLLFIQCDGMEAISKRFGEERKDYVLKTVVQSIQEKLGTEVASIFRIADYRFAIVMPGVDGLRAKDVAMKLRELIASLRFTTPIPSITSSMGLAIFPDNGTDPKILESAAREALDEAVRGGMDQLVIASETGFLRPKSQAPSSRVEPITLSGIGSRQTSTSDLGKKTAVLTLSSQPEDEKKKQGSGLLRGSIPIAPPPEQMKKQKKQAQKEPEQEKKKEEKAQKTPSLFTFRSAKKKEPTRPKKGKESSRRSLLRPKSPSKTPEKEEKLAEKAAEISPEEPEKKPVAKGSPLKVGKIKKKPISLKKKPKEAEKEQKIRKGGKDFVPLKPEPVKEERLPQKSPQKPPSKSKKRPRMRESKSSTSKLPPLPQASNLRKPMSGLIRRSKSVRQVAGLRRRTAGSSLDQAAEKRTPQKETRIEQPPTVPIKPQPKTDQLKRPGPPPRVSEKKVSPTGKPSPGIIKPSGEKPPGRAPRQKMKSTAPLPKLGMKTFKPAVGPTKITPKGAREKAKKGAGAGKGAPPGAKDPITGFYFKSYFERSIGRLMLRAKQTRRPLSLLFFKLDKHKELKSKYGQEKLNNVLREITQMIKNFLKEGSDLPARYSDEIFVIILPDTSFQIGFNLGEQIRFTIGNLSFKDIPGQITLSLGIASFPEKGRSPKEVMKNAYDAMVYAIKTGGNQCLIWDENLVKKK